MPRQEAWISCPAARIPGGGSVVFFADVVFPAGGGNFGGGADAGAGADGFEVIVGGQGGGFDGGRPIKSVIATRGGSGEGASRRALVAAWSFQ